MRHLSTRGLSGVGASAIAHPSTSCAGSAFFGASRTRGPDFFWAPGAPAKVTLWIPGSRRKSVKVIDRELRRTEVRSYIVRNDQSNVVNRFALRINRSGANVVVLALLSVLTRPILQCARVKAPTYPAGCSQAGLERD